MFPDQTALMGNAVPLSTVPYTTPALGQVRYTDEQFGHPCYKGDIVTANRAIEYPDLSVQKGDTGEVMDNLGTHGEAPLNVKWETDTRPQRPSYQIHYEDLTDDSCVFPDAGTPLMGDGQCVGEEAGTMIGDKKCSGVAKAVDSRKYRGQCEGKPHGYRTPDGKQCSGGKTKVCPRGKGNCKNNGFGKNTAGSRRWPRYSAYDEFNYPAPR